MTKQTVRAVVLGFLATVAVPRAGAEVTPHGLFTDNMVLQQGVKTPIWGTSDSQQPVTVSFQEQEVSVTPNDGKWRVNLAPLKPGGPFTLMIKQGSERRDLKDVLVGEVWICGGQSNMHVILNDYKEIEGVPEAIASAANDKIRLFSVPRVGNAEVQTDLPLDQTDKDHPIKATWRLCSPESASNFSALGYYFGRDLQKNLAVPVGLISSNFGGTTAERWMSKEAIQTDPKLVAMKKPQGQCDLYNAMIAPLAPCAIKGAIWYQGESNVERGYEYGSLLPAMIRSWRDTFAQGDFPFLIVQLAPYKLIKSEPGDSDWAELREAQLHTTQTVPKTAQVVITDAGNEGNIHPAKKDLVGARLSLAAQAIGYGRKLEYSGPLYEKMTISGDKVMLSFTHVDSGLVVKPLPADMAKKANVDPQKLNGFTIAGEDEKFYNAQAKIEGDQVLVWSDDVKKPVAVRYGWDDYPVVNLWNNDNLPASPFRTDMFKLSTQPK